MSFSEWKTYKLGDFADVQNGYAFKADDFSDSGIPVIKIKNIVSPNINIDGAQCFEGEITSRLKQFIVKKGDILISMTGSHINQIASAVAKVGKYQFEEPALLNQRVGKVFVFDKTIGDEKYLFYYLNRYDTQYELASSAGGSANQANISPAQIKNLELELPPVGIQKQISSILSSLDDKIELNRQTAQTLESMAQALFKEMCLPKGDELPEGWRVVKLGEVMKSNGGTTPSTKNEEFWNGEIYWATPKDLSDLRYPVLLSTERKITEKGLKQISSGLLPVGTLLMSSRAPIGYFAISQIPVAINQGFIAINGTSVSNLFLLYWLRENIEKIKSMANGSTFLEISKSVFRVIEVIIPDEKTLKLFEVQTASIFQSIVINEQENKTLIHLRDSLLPKLMRGEIEV